MQGVTNSCRRSCFMYLRAILRTFQISVDFYYVPVGGRREGRAGEGGRGRERGIESIQLTVNCTHGYS